MSGSGTSFEIGIGVQANGLQDASTKLAQLADNLVNAKDASTQAAKAVADSEAAYRRAEAAAGASQKALEKINLTLDKQIQAQAKAKQAAESSGDVGAYLKAGAAIEALRAKQAEAQSRVDATAQALGKEAASLDRLRGAAEAAGQNVAKITKEQDATKKAAADAAKALEDSEKRKQDAQTKATESAKKQAEATRLAAEGSGKLNEAAEGFGKLGGPVGMMGQKALGSVEGVKKLFSSVGSGKAIMSLAAIGVVGLVVGLVTLAATAATAAIKIGVWAVGLSDAAASSARLSAGIAGTAKGGAQLEATLDGLQNKLPQSREELQGMAGDLAKSGLKGDALSKALEDAAIKAAKVKFGPDWEKQVNALPNLSKRFSQNISGIFGSLNVDSLLSGLSDLVNLFDANTTAGRAIKSVFGSIFQPAIDGAAGFIPKVVAAFIQFEIWVLKAIIAIKPFGSKIETVGQIFVGLGVTIAAMAAISIGALALLAAMVITPVLAFKDLWNAGKQAYDKLSAMSFSEIGTMLIDGLVNGITGGIDKVITAVTGVADSAINAAKSVLGIASPSKVFAQIGGFTAEGMAGGVDDGAADVQTSLERMTAPPDVRAAGSSANAASSSSTSTSAAAVNITGNTFEFHGVAGAEDAVDQFTEALVGLASQLGAQVAA